MSNTSRIGRALAFTLLALVLVGCKERPEQAAVRTAWEGYCTALDNQDGQGVVKLSSKSTRDYYDRTLKLGLDAPAADVWKLEPIQMREVLMMRNRATRAQLKGYSGKGYVIYSTTEGWNLNGGDDTEWEFKDIKITGSQATARLVEVIPRAPIEFGGLTRRSRMRALARRERPKPREYTISFVSEDQTWKIDEPSLHPRINNEIAAAARQLRMSPREFIMMLEEEETGKDVTMQTWEKMK